jgi:uncharacterized delta-60 repeat protein
MPKKLILLLFNIILLINVNGQQLPLQWARIFDGQGKNADRVSAITTDAAGNIYVAGYSGRHHGAPDAFAMKRNPQGDTLWVYYYDGGKNDDYATDIYVDSNGNTFITGRSQSASYNYECFTAKLLPSGSEDWVSRYSSGGNLQSYGNALTVDAAGNVYVAGYTDPASAGNDWLVIKYNAAGVQQWADVLNGPGNSDDEAMDIAIAPNGNPTACGYTYSVAASGYINAFVKQYTPVNGTAWTDSWSNPNFTGTDKAFGLGFNSAGELFVGGTTVNSSSSNYDSFGMKYDAAGNQQWATIYTDANTNGDEYLIRVTVDVIGNIYLAGTTYQNGYLTCISNTGSGGWRKEWQGPLPNAFEVLNSVAVDNAGNVYTSGRGVYPGPDYYLNGGIPNMIITKYNSAGDSLWTYRAADSLNSSMGFAITVANGKVYAGGFVTDTAYVDENLYTIIVDTSGNAVSEWSYNGRGDAITMGQFVQTDTSNNIYCAATIDRLYAQGYDIAVIKYNPSGDLQWERYYSSPGWNNDTLTGMQFDPSGNLVLSISTDSAQLKNNYRLSLLKIDQQGNFLDTAWFPAPGSILTKSMVIRNDGSVALATNSNINGGMIHFFDASLNPMWSAKLDSTQLALTRANSISLFPGGDIVIGGYLQISPDVSGIVQRYTASGTKLWTTVIDSINVYDEVRDVTVNAANEVAFTGASGANATFAAMVGKIDGLSGNLIWRQVYNPGTTNEYGVKVRYTPAGNIAFISRGWTGFVARYYTVQYSGSGVFQWASVYSQTASDREPVDLIVEPGNRVVTAGWAININTSNHDYVLAGYNSAGAVEFQNLYSTSTSGSFSWDQLFDFTRDSLGDYIQTGITASEFYNTYLFKIMTLKYGGTVVGTEEINVDHNYTAYVYPNPSANGIFEFYDASPEKLTEARIYDLQGRYVKSMNTGTGKIDLSSATPGMYILILYRNNVAAERLRLILK